MVPLPVLWEDVEVFLGKYGFESSDAVGRNERFSPCLRGSMGSLCEFLGGRRGCTQLFRSGFREDSGHEQSVSLLILNFTCPNRGLILCRVFRVLQKGSGPADVEGSSLYPLPRRLFLSYHAASFTSRGASVHLHFSGLPIDLRVVVLEPGITEDHVLLSEAGDSEERSFRVGFVAEDYVYNFGDLACLVGGTVYVVHRYGARDAPGVNAFRSDEVSIYKVAHSSRVQKRFDGMYLAGVSGTDFYWEDDRRSAGVEGVDRESFGQSFFPFWLPGLRCPVQIGEGEKGCVYRFTDICIDLFYV